MTKDFGDSSIRLSGASERSTATAKPSVVANAAFMSTAAVATILCWRSTMAQWRERAVSLPDQTNLIKLAQIACRKSKNNFVSRKYGWNGK